MVHCGDSVLQGVDVRATDDEMSVERCVFVWLAVTACTVYAHLQPAEYAYGNPWFK